MADQVNSTGSLASGLPLALLSAVAARPAPENPRPAKITAPPRQEQGGRTVAEAAKSPEAAMGQLNGYLQQTDSKLQFQVDKSTGRTVFKVIDQATGEVVIQVPSEELLAMARNLRALEKAQDASGVLVDKEG